MPDFREALYKTSEIVLYYPLKHDAAMSILVNYQKQTRQLIAAMFVDEDLSFEFNGHSNSVKVSKIELEEDAWKVTVVPA